MRALSLTRTHAHTHARNRDGAMIIISVCAQSSHLYLRAWASVRCWTHCFLVDVAASVNPFLMAAAVAHPHLFIATIQYGIICLISIVFTVGAGCT